MGSTTGNDLACFGGTPEMDRGLLTEAPLLDEADAETAAAIVRSRQIEPANGRHNKSLRDEWSAQFGAEYCLPVWSGNAALQAALMSAELRPGEEVLVPSLTFTATASAVTRVGALPKFADVDPHTFEIDLEDAARKLTPNTQAIIPVHCHGLPCDMDKVTEFAESRSLFTIEDAAPAPGATFDGSPVGSWGYATIFSFSRGKPIMAGAGGLVTTNDPAIYEQMKRFASQGEDRPSRSLMPGEHRAYRCKETPCDNMRMPEHTAALVRGQLARLPAYLELARENAARLTEGMRVIPGLTPPRVPARRESAWTYFRVLLDLEALDWQGDPVHARDNIIWALFAEGVPVTTWMLEGRDRQVGFRQRLDGSIAPVNPESCPVTQEVLDTSFVLGAAPYMLHVQSARATSRILTAIEKVFQPQAIKRVLAADHVPLMVPDCEEE